MKAVLLVLGLSGPAYADPPGAQFPLCGPAHGLVLALTAGFSAGVAVVLRWVRGTDRESPVRRAICYGLAALLILGLVAEHGAEVIGGYWSLRNSLPLHLCDLAALAVLVALLAAARRGAGASVPGRLRRGEQLACELAYFWGLGGTTQALLTPDVQSEFPTWPCLRFFCQHMLIVIAVAALTLGLGLRPQRGAFGRVWLLTLAAALLALGVNVATGGNYMYLGQKPAQATLLDLLGPYPYSLIGLAAVGTVLLALLYAPYYRLDRREAEQEVNR